MYFYFAGEKLEAAKLDNTQEIVIASEKYVLGGGEIEALDWFLVLGICSVFRPNLYLSPDMDTRCSPNPVCPIWQKVTFHLNMKRLIR